MASITARNAARKPVSEHALLELVGKVASEKGFSLAQLEQILRRAGKKKRGRGRPPRANRVEVLTEAARVFVATGGYRRVAPLFNLSHRQLSNLVARNRAFFDEKVRTLTHNSHL